VLHVKEQGAVPFGLLVWSTGLAPNPLLQSIDSAGVEKHERTGSLITDDKLHLLRRTADGLQPDRDVWAIGDAAIIQGAMLPATAQGTSGNLFVARRTERHRVVASQKAKYVARQLSKPDPSRPFKYRYLGTMVNLGEVSVYCTSSFSTTLTLPFLPDGPCSTDPTQRAVRRSRPGGGWRGSFGTRRMLRLR
jgi:NADH dehydrogenase FAD-containing subunit